LLFLFVPNLLFSRSAGQLAVTEVVLLLASFSGDLCINVFRSPSFSVAGQVDVAWSSFPVFLSFQLISLVFPRDGFVDSRSQFFVFILADKTPSRYWPSLLGGIPPGFSPLPLYSSGSCVLDPYDALVPLVGFDVWRSHLLCCS